jgi:purine-binding chemotaxis protein CheW
MSNDLLAGIEPLLLFTLDEPRFALNLSTVERVVQAVEVMPLPKAPRYVLGVIDVQGQVLPVVDIRQCFGLPPREVGLNDQFILARTANRRVALVVDAVGGVCDWAEHELVPAGDLMPGAGFIHGVAKVGEQLVLICDLEQILVFDDEPALDLARPNATGGPA